MKMKSVICLMVLALAVLLSVQTYTEASQKQKDQSVTISHQDASPPIVEAVQAGDSYAIESTQYINIVDSETGTNFTMKQASPEHLRRNTDVVEARSRTVQYLNSLRDSARLGSS